jgi:hypothetical protein
MRINYIERIRKKAMHRDRGRHRNIREISIRVILSSEKHKD